MGRLQEIHGAASWLLPSRCLIGRSRACTLHLPRPAVSGEHALLRWRRGGWELVDLHSLNGTYVHGRRVEPGVPAQLKQGQLLGFGRPDEFVLQDAGAPRPHAVPLGEPGGAVEALHGLLLLPDLTQPEMTIHFHSEAWWIEEGGDARVAADGEVVTTRAGPWRLHLPEALPPTRKDAREVPVLAALTLRFAVDAGGDYVELLASAGDQVFDFKARAYHVLLLHLARARLAEQHLPAAQQGWIHQDELLGGLHRDVGHLNLNIHRIRRQFAEAGVADAGRIVERRSGTRQLRIGVARIEIVALPGRGEAATERPSGRAER